jgi:ferredoxin
MSTASDERLIMISAITDLWVDTDECLAHFLCVDLAPVFFEMRDGAWAVGVRPTDFTSISATEMDSILWAAAHCPVAAIKVKMCTGEIVDANSTVLRKLAGRPFRS